MTDPAFFTVVADYRSVVADLTTDVDDAPQITPISAVVTFRPLLREGDAILAVDASPRPIGYVPAPIVARLNTQGRLVLRDVPDGTRVNVATFDDLPGEGAETSFYVVAATGSHYRWNGEGYIEILPYQPVRLLADTPLLELNSPLYYSVTFTQVVMNGRVGKLNGFTFQAPNSDIPGGLNLIDVMRQPGQPASGINKIAPGAVRSENGNLVFSFAGVDIPDPIPIDDVTISDDIYAESIIDSGVIGRGMVRADTKLQGREAIGVDLGNVHNWSPTRNTKRVARSLAKAMTPGFAGSHLVIGDSESSLYVGSSPGPAVQYFAMWPYVLRQTLSARGIPLAGTGWVPTTCDASLALDPRYATSGTWTVGFGGISTTASGASLTFTSDLPVTAVSVAYRTTGGPFTVSIDGGAAVAVTPAGGTLDVALYTVTGLSDQTHTVTITRTSGTVWIYALNCYRTSGLQIHNLAQSGTAAHQWAAAASESRSWLSQRLGITPDVVHIALGVNDLNYSRTPAETATNVQTVANLWPNADRILYAQYAPSPSSSVPTPPSDATWADYVSRLYTLADTLDCPLIDLYQRSGGYAAANAAGLMGDLIHPNAVAQADWGRLVASTILKGV